MKRAKCSDITAAQRLGLVQACRDIAGGPWLGTPIGTGRTVPLPPQPSEEQMAADARDATLGWTYWGPQGLGDIDVSVALCTAIDGPEGEAKVRNAATLAHARNALKKSEPMPANVVPAEEVRTQT